MCTFNKNLQDENTFQKIYLNIENASNKWYNGEKLTDLEKILVLFNIDSRKELRRFVKGDKVLMDVARKIEELSLDPEIIGLYNKQKMDKAMKEFDIKEAALSGKAEGEAIGLEKGEAIGLAKRNIEIAKSMLERGMNKNEISEITGLSIEEISKL